MKFPKRLLLAALHSLIITNIYLICQAYATGRSSGSVLSKRPTLSLLPNRILLLIQLHRSQPLFSNLQQIGLASSGG